MKEQYVITKKVLLWLAVFVISMFGAAQSGVRMLAYLSAIPLTAVSETGLSKGDYVSIEIDEYVVSLFSEPDDGHLSGISNTRTVFSGDWNMYTLPFSSDRYVRVWIKDKETNRLLEAFCQGKGEPVAILGVVDTKPEEINTEWYQWTDGVTEDRIIASYVIHQTNSEWIQSSVLFFLLMLVISGFFIVKYSRNEPVQTNKKYPPRAAYAFTDELQIQQNNMKSIKKQLENIKYWGIAGIVFAVAGVYLLVENQAVSIRIVGGLFILFAIVRIWIWFICSNLRFARWINRVLNRRTLQTQKEHIQKQIEDLERRMNI